MKQAKDWEYLVEEYLIDAGFDPFLYYIKPTTDSIEVDFDDQEAVFFIIDDVEKTKYKELFIIDYKKPLNSRRHTAVFFWRRDI